MHARGVLSLSIAAVLLPALLRAQAPQRPPANIGDLIRLATENNRELSALRQRLPESRGMLRQAGAKPAPTLEFSGTTGRPLATVGEEQYSASYNRTIETGGKRARRIEVAEIGVAVAQAEFDERLRQIGYDIAVLYADATAQQQRVQRFERLVALNQESIRLTQARVREGDAAQLETQLLEVDLSRAEAERVTALGQLDAILIQLKQLVGIEPSEQLLLAQPPRITALADVGELQSRASADRADLRLARFLEQQGGAEVRLATAQGTPDLTLTANVSRVYSRFDDQFGLSPSGTPVQLRDRDDVITVGVQIPLGTKRRNQGNVEAAGARAAGARLRREYLERQAAAEVAAAARRFTAAQSRLGILESRVLGQSEKNLDVIRQAYQLGQFRLLDVLAEQRRFVETQLNYIEAQAELMKSTAELERAVGGEIR